MYNKKYIHSSAISQQNKLSSKFTTISKLNPHYVTGFTDAEGCFFIGVNPDSKHKTGYRIKASFQIGLRATGRAQAREKDLALLKEIKLFFGVGNISKLGQESVQFRVSPVLRPEIKNREIQNLH
jgi:hypothetical protein